MTDFAEMSENLPCSFSIHKNFLRTSYDHNLGMSALLSG